MRTEEKIVLGGGCFWCTEAVFKMLKGVVSVTPGYAGGRKDNPTYAEISGGNTGHVEVVEVVYKPEIIPLESILTVFFGSHDPTTVNRQGNDVGEQYRSVIFYKTDEQRRVAETFVHDLNESDERGKPVVTTIEPLQKFFEAEEYHKDYYARNKNQGYCQLVINPKLEKVQRKFAELLKEKIR